MRSVQRFYFAATICMILLGIGNANSVKGADTQTESAGFTQKDNQKSESSFATKSQDQESSHAASKRAPVADSRDPAPPALADSKQNQVDSTPMTNNQQTIEGMLYSAITSRIGIPYRSGGTDDKGYDCSGFVWRVFQDAGVHFDRSTAHNYWKTMPEATEEEKTQFGTLVFFDNSKHVGVVRDAYSFYHASSSHGVMRSNFSDYWAAHIVGYRRIRLPEDINTASNDIAGK